MHNSFGAQVKMAGPEQCQQSGTVNVDRYVSQSISSV